MSSIDNNTHKPFDESIYARLRQERRDAEENPFVYFFGYIYLALSIAALIPSLLVILVLFRPRFLRQPFYQLLAFFFTLVTVNLILTGFLAGIYSILQCDFKSCEGMPIVGSLQVGAWTALFVAALLLYLNRIIALASKKLTQTLFTGRKTLTWAFMATFLGAHMLIPFDGEPFYHYDSSEAIWNYELVPLGTRHVRFIAINLASVGLNTILILVLFYSTRKRTHADGESSSEIVQTSYLALTLGIPIVFLNIIFTMILYSPQPPLPVNVFYMCALQLTLGFLSIHCLLKNKAIGEVILRCCCRKPPNATSVYAPERNAPAQGANPRENAVTEQNVDIVVEEEIQDA